MISSWGVNHKYYHRIIESGADEFVDERGIISNYYVDDSINMIGYVESRKVQLEVIIITLYKHRNAY